MNPLPINTEESPPYMLELIYRLKVRDVMTTQLVTAGRSDTLRYVQGLMKSNGITGVPVVEGKRLVGLLSMDDIVCALDEGYIDSPAADRMSRNLIVLEDDMPLSFGISYMEKYRFGRFPVLNRNKELVGIVTSRDVIVALLLEINRDVERLEKLQTKSEEPDERATGVTRREFRTRKFDFESAGRASSQIKLLMKEKGIDPGTTRRVAVAAYELEMNQVVHSDGGRIQFILDDANAVIEAEDQGPGIENVDLALQEGFSTATEWIRSLGFGAGMGLPNARRVSDEFSLSSSSGSGTRVRSVVHLHSGGSDENQ